MKVILIQGRVNAGKTTLCNVIKTSLQKKGTEEQLYTPTERDFYNQYKINDKTIIVVSASDRSDLIKKLKRIVDKNECDIVITAVRPNKGNDKDKELHDAVRKIFIDKGIEGEDITTIDLDTLTNEFIENTVFNNHFIPTFDKLIN